MGSAWRKVDGMAGDGRTSRKLKIKALTSYFTPVYMCALGTMALIEKQQE